MSRQARLNELGVRWRSGPSEASSSSSQPAMRQGTITGLQGVRNWKNEAENAAVEGLSDIPSTLYLGQEDVEKLRGMLIEASARGDSGARPCNHGGWACARARPADSGRLRLAADMSRGRSSGHARPAGTRPARSALTHARAPNSVPLSAIHRPRLRAAPTSSFETSSR